MSVAVGDQIRHEVVGRIDERLQELRETREPREAQYQIATLEALKTELEERTAKGGRSMPGSS